MSKNRSTMLVLIGVAFFLAGTAGALLLVRDDSGGTRARASTAPAKEVARGAPPAPSAAGAGGASAAVAAEFTIPAGKTATAVSMAFVPGLAGYAKPGDHVNVYATIKPSHKAPFDDPRAKLVLSNVEVLAATAPSAAVTGGNSTFVLALDAKEAEQVIFLAAFESLYMTLMPEGQAPAAPSAGTNYGTFAK